MRRLLLVVLAALLTAPPIALAQTRKPPAGRGRGAAPAPAVPAAPPIKVAPETKCPAPLGTGVVSKREYCDVMSGREPEAGIVLVLPPHQGPVTLTFDLHNRHTYSEEQMKTNRAAARYTAVIGVLTKDNTLISRAAVQSEFRKASDLVERIGGGAGPGGVKAVAPTGTEAIRIAIPPEETEVSLLGEKLIIDRPDGTATYTSPGRPIAVISNVMIEYRPAPPPRPARGRSSR